MEETLFIGVTLLALLAVALVVALFRNRLKQKGQSAAERMARRQAEPYSLIEKLSKRFNE